MLQLWKERYPNSLESRVIPGATVGQLWRERDSDLLGSQTRPGTGMQWGNGLCAERSKPALLLERAVVAELCSGPLRECPSRTISFFCSTQLQPKMLLLLLHSPQREASVER